MSRNYIKVLLEPFRESKVLGSLLKWLKLSASDSAGVVNGAKNKVGVFYLVIFLWGLEVK